MTIEISIVRGILTLLLMLSFITLVVWLYSRRNKNAYDYAARLPLEDDELSVDASVGKDDSGSKQS